MSESSSLDPLCLAEGDLSFATDLYQLTMAAVYHLRTPDRRGSFELFVRRIPERRNFLVLAGLEQALAALQRLRFTPYQLEYLRSVPAFADVSDSYFETLLGFRFRGRVQAMPEGTVFFAREPVLRVTGTLLEAQIVETLLLSTINFQSAIASKAARIRLAAGDDVVLSEFGGRRAHGPQAATWAARAAYLGGFDSTSNVLAGQRLGIPVAGTMAHSFVLAFASEIEAFRQYAQVFPRHSTMLVDTYDTLEGVRTALAAGVPFAAVRLDSGDLLTLARETRTLLDRAGRTEARIFASGDLNEEKLSGLVAADAPIDAFGVGTQLATSADAPFLGGIYKLVDIELNGRVLPRQKLSEGKRTLPGKKQVYRRFVDGRMAGDRIALEGGSTARPDERALLRPVLEEGRLLVEASLASARARCRGQLAALPERLRHPVPADDPYPVALDPELASAAGAASPDPAGPNT